MASYILQYANSLLVCQCSGVGCQVSGVRFSDDRKQMVKTEDEATYLGSTRLNSPQAVS